MILLARWTRFFYSTTLPSLKTSGWNQVETTLEDHLKFREVKKSGKKLKKKRGTTFGKAFGLSKFKLVPEIKNGIAHMKKGPSKKSGTASNMRSSACTAWLANYAANNFAPAQSAWSGTGWTMAKPWSSNRNALTVFCTVFSYVFF